MIINKLILKYRIMNGDLRFGIGDLRLGIENWRLGIWGLGLRILGEINL